MFLQFTSSAVTPPGKNATCLLDGVPGVATESPSRATMTSFSWDPFPVDPTTLDVSYADLIGPVSVSLLWEDFECREANPNDCM